MAVALQRAVWAVNAHQPVGRIDTLDNVRDRSMWRYRFTLLLLGIFAGAAVVLAIVGIYGVMAYLVNQRRFEMGVRMALGGRRRDMFQLALGQGLRSALLGVGLGLAGSVAVTGLLSSVLYEVSATDPLVLVGMAVLLTGVSALACLVPAWRGSGVDPIVVLRAE